MVGHRRSSKARSRISVSDSARLDFDDDGVFFSEPQSPSQKVAQPSMLSRVDRFISSKAHEIQKCKTARLSPLCSFHSIVCPLQVYEMFDLSKRPTKGSAGETVKASEKSGKKAQRSARQTPKENSKHNSA